MEGPLGEPFAALEGPRAVVGSFAPDGNGFLGVTAGACLAELRLRGPDRDRLARIQLQCPAAVKAQCCALRFSVAAVTPGAQQTVQV